MRKLRAGLTLVELLAVIGIIAVLTAILAPVLIQSRRSAQQSSDLEKMKQLGHAWNLYVEEAGDYPPSAEALQSIANLPESVYASNLDANSEGIATQLCRNQPNLETKTCLAFKRTFVTYLDSGGKWWFFKENILAESNPGWLFDPSSLKMTSLFASGWSGTYRRLTMEGSVLTRQQKLVSGVSKSGVHYFGSHPGFLYCDPSEETRKKWLPQPP